MPEGPRQSMGATMRRLRLDRDLTLDRLARMSDLTRGYLSLVERDLKVPSVTALMRVATSLQVPIAELFGAPEGNGAKFTLQRASAFREPASDDVPSLVSLAAARPHKMLEPFLLRPSFEVEKDPSIEWTHAGDEILFVVSGRIAVMLGGEEVSLDVGDCLYFSGGLGHRIRSLGTIKATVLIVIASQAAAASGATTMA